MGLVDMAGKFLTRAKRPLVVATGKTMFATEGSIRNRLQEEAASSQT